MLGCRILASTACLLISQSGTHAFATTSTSSVRSFATKTHASPRDSQFASTSLEASMKPETLLSVQQCIAAFDQEQKQRRTRQEQGPQARSQPSKIVFIDGSWYHKPDPTTGLLRNPSQEYIVGPRLPSARFLDIDAIATTFELFPDENPKALPHMMPPPKLFGLAMDAYNICNEDHIVVYARRGALFTPRVWFLFVSMGHDPKKVHLMQGSLEDYMEKGGLVETDSLLTKYNENGHDQYYANMGGSYVDCFDLGILDVPRLYHTYYSTTKPQYSSDVSSARNICGKAEVLDAVSECLAKHGEETKSTKESFRSTVILDTRGSSYAKEGHIPSAVHLPYSQIATSENSLMIQPKPRLEKLFKERGINYLDQELKIILSCGSGVSVCHGYLALKELGRNITEENTRIYDGSWKEWGKEGDLPKNLPGEMR